MDTLRLIFTKTEYSPASWIIRWTLPRSRFSLALSSHVIIQNGNDYYQALPFVGVQKTDEATAMAGCTVVKTIDFEIPNLENAIYFLGLQVGKPYDMKGALGLGIDPDRDWSDTTGWFCYELAAAALNNGGLKLFPDLLHITETALFAVNPTL